MSRPKKTDKAKPHAFESLGEFDRAMRHIVSVPKEAVDKKIAAEQAKKKRKK
jgi:hypothetical protein